MAHSLHPGQAYEEANNGNESQVHWDMVNIQRKSGVVVKSGLIMSLFSKMENLFLKI